MRTTALRSRAHWPSARTPPTRSRSASSARCPARAGAIGVEIRDALPAGGEDERRQARRPARRGAGRRRPVQARRRPPARRALRQARQVNLLTGIVFSNIMLASVPIAFENKMHLRQPERGALAASPARTATRTSSSPPGRTTPTTRPPASTPPTEGLQERLPDRAELPGRQGLARRLQALLQGQRRRRGLHAARPARLLRRARAGARRQARRAVHLPARRHGHQLHQAVRRRRPVDGRAADRAGLRRRPGHHPRRSASRCSACSTPRTGRSTSTTPPTEIRRRLREGVQAPAVACSPRRATTRRC